MMNSKWMLSGLVAVAVAAGFCGSLVSGLFQPGQVEAQALPPIKIALVNIEKAAKESAIFKEKKSLWDAAQADLRKQREAIEAHIEDVKRQAQRTDKPEALATLKAQMEALKGRQEEAMRSHEKYLGDLMAQYQDEVLKKVKGVVEDVATVNKFHIVFQDYDEPSSSGSSDFFGGTYAQTLLNKPVFFAPGVTPGGKPNEYVQDITETVIAKLK
jgi:Skp family chaperone for outer membrane proteins